MALSDFLNRYRTLSFYSQYSPIKLNESQKKICCGKRKYYVQPKREVHVPQICLVLHRKGIHVDKN